MDGFVQIRFDTKKCKTICRDLKETRDDGKILPSRYRQKQ